MFIQVFLLCTNMKKCIPCIQGKKCHLRLQCLEMQYSFIPWGTRSYMTHQQISWSDASLFFRAVSIVSPITCIIFHMVRRLGETWYPCLISWCVQLFFFSDVRWNHFHSFLNTLHNADQFRVDTVSRAVHLQPAKQHWYQPHASSLPVNLSKRV